MYTCTNIPYPAFSNYSQNIRLRSPDLNLAYFVRHTKREYLIHVTRDLETPAENGSRRSCKVYGRLYRSEMRFHECYETTYVYTLCPCASVLSYIPIELSC